MKHGPVEMKLSHTVVEVPDLVLIANITRILF